MGEFLVKNIVTDNIEDELIKIGFDNSYRFNGAEKFRYKNFKIYNLSPAQANILKQTALTVGADCATNKEVIRGNVEYSNVILGGSVSQLKKIGNKLQYQPFNLKRLGEQILLEIEQQKRKTKIVGILNITPDSFSDGGLYFQPEDAQKHLLKLISDGADIIDIGAESTRPYSEEIDAKEQIRRLTPILKFIQQENLSVPISIDTRNSEVADFVLNNGASIINDVSGFDYDNKMPQIISKYNSKVIIQHSKGNPENMQNNPVYNDVVEEIYISLKQKIEIANEAGIKHIIIDPGIGFGKTKEHNIEILNRIEEFYPLKLPIMVGISRKKFLGIKENDNNLKDSITIALSYPLIQKGVDYLRVHNVKLHKIITELK